VLIALFVRRPATARRAGLVVALTGALIHTLWTNVLLPVVAALPYGGPRPGMVWSLVVAMALNLLVVVAAALCGWAAPIMRRIGALLAAVVGVLGIAAATETLDAFGVGYGTAQVVQALLTLGAVPLAVIAGRRQASARQAEH
jgi:hypothetical protein